MNAKRGSAPRPIADEEINTADRIISTATRLFADQGFDGTTTKNICDAAGVNIAAIHYHFGSKEGLLRHLLESFGGSRLQLVRKILEVPANVDELRVRLQIFLSESLEAFVKQPELCRIVQTEIELLDARSEDVFQRTFQRLFEALVEFLSHARKKGLIAKEIDVKIAARGLFSQLCHQSRTDAVHFKRYGVSFTQEAYRNTWVQQTLRMFLEGVVAK